VSAEDASRREVVLKGTVTAVAAAAGLVLGGVAAGLGRLAGGTKNGNSGTTLSAPASSAAPSQQGPTASGSGGGQPAGTAIGPAKDVPVGGAASFTDPRTGDPSIVIQAKAGKFVAFDAVCPHAGCTVGYDQTAAVILCPCHGSQFNAATGAVERGPAVTGLTSITIAEGGNGQLYAT
jgi:thiosulfate dehydrogenase [quinone] large subunit